jgi:hypothetical protein
LEEKREGKGKERKGRETTGFLGHDGEKQEEKANHKCP